MRHLKNYKVYYSNHATAKVRAFTVGGARLNAWNMISGRYTYGWTKKEFLKKAKVVVL